MVQHSPHTASPLVKPSLTRREKEILQLVAHGRINKEIANSLCISDETVKKHLRNVYAKLKVQNRIEALIKLGWL